MITIDTVDELYGADCPSPPYDHTTPQKAQMPPPGPSPPSHGHPMPTGYNTGQRYNMSFDSAQQSYAQGFPSSQGPYANAPVNGNYSRSFGDQFGGVMPAPVPPTRAYESKPQIYTVQS